MNSNIGCVYSLSLNEHIHLSCVWAEGYRVRCCRSASIVLHFQYYIFTYGFIIFFELFLVI